MCFFLHTSLTNLITMGCFVRGKTCKPIIIKSEGRVAALAPEEINYSPPGFLFFSSPISVLLGFIRAEVILHIGVTLLFRNWNLFEMYTDESGILINGASHKKEEKKLNSSIKHLVFC